MSNDVNVQALGAQAKLGELADEQLAELTTELDTLGIHQRRGVITVKLINAADGSKDRHYDITHIAKNLLAEPYLATDPKHQGLILHSVYHRPNGWDHIPPGSKVPVGESSMWGDYHARELALMIYREAKQLPDYQFFIRA